MALHTILGANGTIATELLPILLQNGERVRLVSRRAKPVDNAEVIAADLLNAEQVMMAVDGSHIVYLLVGLEYKYKVWQRDWPVLMRNVIAACKKWGAKLIFFDNVYPYGIPDGDITETSPFRPVSRKGTIRAQVDSVLLTEMNSGMPAIITRAADFYGPRAVEKSAPGLLVFSRMKKGQRPQWLVNPNVPRTLTYTPDAAKAIYILSQHPEAFGKTWILPTAKPALTGKQFIALAAKYMNGNPSVQVLPKWLIGLAGWFSPMLREIHEMLYQDEYGYTLNSSLFEKTFRFVSTSYEEGIQATAHWYLNHQQS